MRKQDGLCQEERGKAREGKGEWWNEKGYRGRREGKWEGRIRGGPGNIAQMGWTSLKVPRGGKKYFKVVTGQKEID